MEGTLIGSGWFLEMQLKRPRLQSIGFPNGAKQNKRWADGIRRGRKLLHLFPRMISHIKDPVVVIAPLVPPSSPPLLSSSSFSSVGGIFSREVLSYLCSRKQHGLWTVASANTPGIFLRSHEIGHAAKKGRGVFKQENYYYFIPFPPSCIMYPSIYIQTLSLKWEWIL